MQGLPSMRRTLQIAPATLAVGILALGGAGCARSTGDGASAPPAVDRRGGFEGAPTGIRFLADEGVDEGVDEGADEGAANGSDGDFARATVPVDFEFPRDHASHPPYRTEWWYFTGNLDDGHGREFGFEFTVFRYALTAGAPPETESAWSVRDAWMAHLAITDATRGVLLAEERLSRGALGIAGATADPVRVWVENWSMTQTSPDPLPTFALSAAGERIAIALELRAEKPAVYHGEAGLDPKGPEPGNASYYYSFTRLAAAGAIRVDGRHHEVTGTAWMDREWSTSVLSPEIEGWDWFALQFSDHSELMLYRLRGLDGSTSRFSGGSFIEPDGTRRALGPDDFRLEPLEEWRSPASGTTYPIAWRIEVNAPVPLELTVEPYIPAQEIALSVRYWEGAVHIQGRRDGQPVDGRGYVELAGY